MNYRIWSQKDGTSAISVEAFTADEKNAVAVARALMSACQDDRVYIEDVSGNNPREVFQRARSAQVHMIVAAQNREELLSLPPMLPCGCVGRGCVHDIVDLSLLA